MDNIRFKISGNTSYSLWHFALITKVVDSSVDLQNWRSKGLTSFC